MEDLFLLVKSMNKSEKRHFRLYSLAFSKEEADYLRLFELINKQKVYNDEKLKAKLKLKHFTVTKRYLFDAILKSLRTYLTDEHSGFQMLDAFKNISILRNRGLIREAIKLYNKTEKDLLQQNLYTLLIELQHTGEVLWSLYLSNKELPYKLAEIEQKKTQYILELSNLTQYQMLSRSIRNTYRDLHPIRNKTQETPFLKFLENPLLADIGQAQTVVAESYFYESMTLCYTALLNFEKVKEYAMEAVEQLQLEENKSIIRYKALMINLSNLLLACSRTGDLESYKKYAAFYEECLTKVQGKFGLHFEVLSKKLYYNFLLNFYLEVNDFESIVKLEEEISSFRETFKEFLDVDWNMTISFCMAQALFFCNKYEQAIEWVNVILNEEKNNPKTPCICNARILHLMIHFEMKNYDLLRSLFRSTYRFLTKNERLFNSERLMLNYFNWVSEHYNEDIEEKKRKLFGILETEIAENIYENNFYEEMKLELWQRFNP